MKRNFYRSLAVAKMALEFALQRDKSTEDRLQKAFRKFFEIQPVEKLAGLFLSGLYNRAVIGMVANACLAKHRNICSSLEYERILMMEAMHYEKIEGRTPYSTLSFEKIYKRIDHEKMHEMAASFYSILMDAERTDKPDQNMTSHIYDKCMLYTAQIVPFHEDVAGSMATLTRLRVLDPDFVESAKVQFMDTLKMDEKFNTNMNIKEGSPLMTSLTENMTQEEANMEIMMRAAGSCIVMFNINSELPIEILTSQLEQLDKAVENSEPRKITRLF